MIWAGPVAHMGAGRGEYRALVGKSEGNNHLQVPGVDGSIIIQWIFMKWDRCMTGLIWLRIGTGGGLL